ncbi:hypothetical protein HRW18_18440 [Streptomyces lunaelactis]|uniref:hypothetical protein n=1 Tax=Streptomyces lunaelactis TaxID=1535768 RepID=UPI001584FBD9|nr:hypothetical protein [Streptomyces lunaelactis]NUK09945.1 hypothetical protein [Streptomyces lunaelactis]NUK72745.1 hypothetical protein [Streptomyces lunaelactis]NUL11409.1 hypothetical protein [Streptomyces lunaelactis]NUL25978.1 hypothetical protein [Streptomyces lunaelactis]
MNITRYGKPCPLCRTPLLVDVYQVRSSESPLVQREQINRRRCPGCQTARPEQWTEVMRDHYGDA